MRKLITSAVTALALGGGVAAALPSAASANGPCGVDYDGNHACPITAPYSTAGSLVTTNESDYYVFYGTAGMQVSATITAADDPGKCASGNYYYGYASVGLMDAQGNGLDSRSSRPSNGLRRAADVGAHARVHGRVLPGQPAPSPAPAHAPITECGDSPRAAAARST